MKIIITTRGKSSSGGSAYLSNIITYFLKKEDVEKVVLVAPENLECMDSNKFVYEELKVPGKYFITKEFYFFFKCAQKMKKLTKYEKFDIINHHASVNIKKGEYKSISTFHILHSGMIKAQREKKLSTSYSDCIQIYISKIFHKIYSIFDNSRAKKSSLNIYVSKDSCEYMNNIVNKVKNIHIPNCVNTKLFFPISEKDELFLKYEIPHKSDCVYALFVGRLDYTKGIDKLVEAVKGMNNLILLTVGDGFYYNTLKKMINVYPLKNIKNKDMYEIYNLADFLILPSVYENCPTTVLEAMSCGIPVIASKVGDIPIIINKYNGVLLNNLTVIEIYNKINSFLKDKNAIVEMGLRARETILNSYSSEIISEKVYNQFKMINEKK